MSINNTRDIMNFLYKKRQRQTKKNEFERFQKIRKLKLNLHQLKLTGTRTKEQPNRTFDHANKTEVNGVILRAKTVS